MKKKTVIPIVIFLIILFVIPLSLIMLSGKKSEKKVSLLNHKKAEGLYTESKIGLCTDIPKGDNIALFLVFGQMKKDKVLTDSIDMEILKKEARKIVKEIPNNINYTYEGYKYTNDGNKMVRKKAECGDKDYVSKLYGYSTDEDKLYLTITSGYINNTKVYDLDGNEIGEYSKENINTLLDKGTMQNYTYQKNEDKYIFETAQ